MSPAVVECGALWTRILRAGADRPDTYPAAPRERVEAFLRERFARFGIPREPLAFVVPDQWLDGDRDGILRHDEFRRGLGSFRELSWYGRSPSVAALAAHHDGPGTYLVCDLGWTGASLGVCRVVGTTVEVLATAFEPEAGGRAYAEAVTEGMPAAVREGFAETMEARAERARAVLPRADENSDDPVYAIGGTTIEAGLLIARFRPLADLLNRRIRALEEPTATLVLSGGFAEFPLVAPALPGPVRRLGPDAAVHGARLLDQRAFGMAPPARREAALALHRVHHGLLETRRIPLTPAPADFAELDRRPLLVSDTEVSPDAVVHAADRRLGLTLDGVPGTIEIPAGTYRVGLRRTYTGASLLLVGVRPTGTEPALLPLTTWEPA